MRLAVVHTEKRKKWSKINFIVLWSRRSNNGQEKNCFTLPDSVRRQTNRAQFGDVDRWSLTLKILKNKTYGFWFFRWNYFLPGVTNHGKRVSPRSAHWVNDARWRMGQWLFGRCEWRRSRHCLWRGLRWKLCLGCRPLLGLLLLTCIIQIETCAWRRTHVGQTAH